MWLAPSLTGNHNGRLIGNETCVPCPVGYHADGELLSTTTEDKQALLPRIHCTLNLIVTCTHAQ